MIRTELVNVVKDYLQKNLFEKANLRIKVKVHLEFCLMADKVNLYSNENEGMIKELYHAITGKPYTRDISMENQDYDS